MPQARDTEFVNIRDLPPPDLIFGQSSMISAARERLERAARTTVPVLLQGESGTGKEIFAKLLHAYSNRSNYAWVKVACSAIPHSLIESELFGYEKGAFTGAHKTKRGRVELAHAGPYSWTKSAASISQFRRSCCKSCRTAALCELGRRR